MSSLDVDHVVAQRYRPASSLHRGQGVETLLAHDLAGDRPVVLKVAAADALSDVARRRLEHESLVLARMDHPHLARLVDRGRDGELIYLVTPWVPGRSLDARLVDGPLSVTEALLVARQVVAALCHAHDLGVLHRDIKPANVVAEGDPVERAVLIDFGLARSDLLDADVRDVPVGSVRYLSPEQAGLISGPVDERSDLYSLGLTMIECLRGRPVFDGERVGEVLKQQMTAVPPRLDPSIPAVFGHILDRLVRRDPAERYQSATAVLHDLDQLAEGLAAGVGDPTFAVGTRDRRETLAEPTFTGREEELAALEGHVAATIDGRGGVVLLGAESGAGKSRLLAELTRRVSGRVRLFHGQGLDQAAQRPYQVLSGVVRDVLHGDDRAVEDLRERLGDDAAAVAVAFPELGSALGVEGTEPLGPEEFGEVRTLRALGALLDALGTAGHPALVVLDDCQWADELSGRLLTRWGASADVRSASSQCHVLVVLAYRSDELGPESAIRDLDPLDRVSLRPMAASDIEALAVSMAGALPDEVLEVVGRLSEGSPFMAAAVLRGLVEAGALASGPEGWEVEPTALADARSSRRAGAVLAHRITLLGDETRRLLAVGAVLGTEFEIDVAAALSEVDPVDVARAVREASRRHLVWSNDAGSCSFVHDKIREALLHQLGDEERRALHERTATLLEVSSPTRFFDLAFHFDAAGYPDRALPFALAAAEEARAQQSLEVVEQQYRIAARGARAAPEMQSRIAEELGRVLMLRGRYEEAAQQLQHARALGDDPHTLARVDGVLGELAFKRGDMAASSEALERAVRTLGHRMPRRGWLLFTMWEVLVQVVHTVASRTIGRRALHDPRAEADLLGARLYSRLAHTYWFQKGSVPTAFVHLRGLNITERYPPTLQRAQAYSEHAPVMSLLPWYRRGIDYAERSLRIRRDFGDLFGQGQSLHFHGVVLYAASRWEECIERCREAARLLDRTGDRWEVNTARWHIAYSSYRSGDLATAATIGEQVWRAGTELGDPQARCIGLAVWSKATGGMVPEGDVAAELEQLSDDAHAAAEVLSAEGIRLLGAGRPSEAVAVLRRADRLVRAAHLRQEYVAPVPAWLLTALRAERESSSPHLDLRRRRRELREARRLGRRARRLALAYRNNLPHALREAAMVEAAIGRRRRARRWLDRSLAVAEELGARQEVGLTLTARGELGRIHGWSTAEDDIVDGHRRLEELGTPVSDDREPITVSLADRYDSLLSAGHQVASSLTVDGAFSALAEAAASLLRPQDCLVLGTRELDRSAAAATMSAVAGSGVEPSATLVDDALRGDQPVAVHELLDADASDSMVLSGVRSVLCAPVCVRGEAVACLYVSHRDIGGAFGEDEMRIAGFLTALAGAALENAEGFAEIEALTRTLEQRVAERTLEVTAANERLRRLDQFRTEMIAITAHDLRAPLSIIVGFASTLHDHAERFDDEQRRSILQRIVVNTRRLSEFVENLLQFARIESDELQLDAAPFDLATLVRRTVGEFEASEPDRRFDVRVPDDVPTVVGDQSRQWQVLVNLLSNACKYSPPEAPITVEVLRQDDVVEVSVRDRGDGIPAEELPKLFGKFARVDSSNPTKTAMGSGLGLYICRSLVEAHGGEIGVTSTVGEGSTFRYTVPLEPPTGR